MTGEISVRGAEFRRFMETPSREEVMARLGSAALVEMTQFSEIRDGQPADPLEPLHYGAYVAGPAGLLQWIDLGPAKRIDELIERYRAATEERNAAVARESGKELARLLFEPVRRRVPEVTEFYISADGQVRLISFAGLLDDDGQPLVKRFAFYSLLSGRDLVLPPPMSPKMAPIVAGILDFGESRPGHRRFSQLPGADAEAAEVVKRIPDAQRVPAALLTRTYLIEQVDAPQILHLATHGFGPEPDGGDPLTRAGIALHNANSGEQETVLTAKDAAMLRLRGTDLVVLSACETGIGELSYADGVTGLQRSLLLAGARSQMLTLWPVHDDWTRKLMVEFYRNLFEKKMTKGEALRQAQITLANQVEPFGWAGFVLYGDSGPILQ